ncbi:MAG: hypothetical protein V1934_05005 [Methanobacteriota archaeon]
MKAIIIVLVALAMLGQAAHGSEAALEEGATHISETIAAGDFRAYVVEMGRDDALKVRLSESSGARLDFFLTNYSAYLVYKSAIPGVAWDFFHLGGEYSAKSVSGVDYTYNSLRADTMVLIVDNTNRTDEGADGVGAVEVSGTITLSANFWGFGEMAAIGVVALAMAAVIGMALMRKGGRKPASRPPAHTHAKPTAKPPGGGSQAQRPARKLLRPVLRSSIQNRKPLSPKKGMRGR